MNIDDPPRLSDGYACENSEQHELAVAIDDDATSYCVDCRRRVRLVPRKTIVVSRLRPSDLLNRSKI